MIDNVINLQSRRAQTPRATGYFDGTVLGKLGTKPSESLAELTLTARGMRRPVTLRVLLDANWPASEVMEQLQVMLLREPRANATLTRADGLVVGDSHYLWFVEHFAESHATTIAEACTGGAVFDFDPSTDWQFDVEFSATSPFTEINAGELLELLDQTGAIPLGYTPQMADGALALFAGETIQPRLLAELLYRHQLTHFPPPGTIDARPQLLVYWILRELEATPEYMQVIDVVAEAFPDSRRFASKALTVQENPGTPLADDEAAFLRTHAFIRPEGDGWALANAATDLAELHQLVLFYAVLGSYTKQLDKAGRLDNLPGWRPSTRYDFKPFDLQEYAAEMSRRAEEEHPGQV